MLNPFIPAYLAGLGRNPVRVERLIKETGSKLSATQLSHYKALFQDRNHVEGALLMMSQWNLDRLLMRLDVIKTHTLFLAAERDGTVPTIVSYDRREKILNAETILLPGLGHLAHEEKPDLVHQEIIEFISKTYSNS